MKTFKLIEAGLLAVLFCFTIVSCSEDPKTDDLNLIEILKKNKWTYKYVDDFTDTSYGGFYGTSTYYLYFLDDNIGYQYDVYTDNDSYFGTETSRWFGKFTYSISGNTINIRYADEGNKATFEYVSGFLVNDGDYYTPKVMTQSDRDFLNNQIKQLGDKNVDKELELDLYSHIDELITVTGDFIEEDLMYRFTVNWDELNKKYPQKYSEFTFGAEIEYVKGLKDEDPLVKYTLDMSGKSCETFRAPVLFGTSSMYMSTYENIRAKIDAGESLTESEKELFETIVKDLKRWLSSIKIRIFLEWDGVKFDIYEHSFSANVELDSSYEDPKENNSYTGIIQGYEYVDLGLSVKWATCNVGADSPEEHGGYFAWGETTTKSDYDWDTYKWCKGTDETITKYCTDSDYGTVDNRTTLTSSDDVATVKWGSRWRMPTLEEVKELVEDCTWTWTTQSGVNGMKVTGHNGNSIFLPAAGYRDGTDFKFRGSYGYYWSAALSEYRSYCAYTFGFHSGGSDWGSFFRYRGHTVRPVTE